MTPRLLDLFSGAGGAAMGYYRAGFTDITGIDNRPMPRYPFKFIQADALEYLAEHGAEYDMIHASPPCQAYTVSAIVHRNRGKKYPDLIGATRELLIAIGAPWIIENVPGAPLNNPAVLCGLMFGLKVFRHSLFETSFEVLRLSHIPHGNRHIGDGYFSVAGGSGRWKSWGTVKRNISKGTVAEWRAAMGIDWMTRYGLTQAIPPAYTEWIGKQIMPLFSEKESEG